jgi:hypothetical protein
LEPENYSIESYDYNSSVSSSIFFISIANFPASPAENYAAEEKSPVPYYFYFIFYIIWTKEYNFFLFMCVKKLKMSSICLPLERIREGSPFFEKFILFSALYELNPPKFRRG